MTHDTDKAKQDKRLAEQGKALSESRRFAFFLFFFNLRGVEQKNGDNGHYHINREKNPPAQIERRNSLRRSPHGNVWCQERSNRLYELSESQAARQAVTTHDIGEQRVQRSLHQRISDSQQREGNQHQHITVTKNRQQ